MMIAISKRATAATRRYFWRIAAAMALYIGSLYACEILIEDNGLAGPAAYALAALPGLAFAAVPWIFTRLIVEETDEFFRMLYVRQLLVASGLTLTAAAVWGFLETYLPVPHIAAFWWPTLWCFGLGVGAVYDKVTMGVAGECR
ncbi:hypothetical protein [Aurantiacibacter gangjinensis]|nr:hypothetical protein [Aurantiacibacter gangjinensis]APE29442.1 hypothetical protein BMF35_b0187 [Aurantiacibacter gangjinensis]